MLCRIGNILLLLVAEQLYDWSCLSQILSQILTPTFGPKFCPRFSNEALQLDLGLLLLTRQLGKNRGIVGLSSRPKTRQDNSVELEASLAPTEAEVGAVAKADQKKPVLKMDSLSFYSNSPTWNNSKREYFVIFHV